MQQIEKKIEDLKRQMHNSVDVASRIVLKTGKEVGFVYLKSMTDNLIFSQGVFEPISNFEGELNFEKLKQLV
ncbi:MAG: hypothetical protein J6J24_01850, partial [Clostridia bacterium]|nr:hypothetical protein [Clostridia bacterium]